MDKSNPWNPANLLFTSDYDCTFTLQDTCELLVWAKEDLLELKDGGMMNVYLGLWDEYEVTLKEHIAAMADSREEGDTGREPMMSRCGVALTLENFVELGIDPRLESAVKACLETEQAACDAPVDGQFDSRNLRTALKQLAGLERVINKTVIATGFLGGLEREAIRSAGGRAAMQNHCLAVLSRFMALGTPIHVISANWSRDIIYGGLASLPEEHLFVHCNDLEFDASGKSTGYFANRVTNALDKETVQQALRKVDNCKQPSSERRQPKMAVYFGDAQTDLLALLDADLGIVMGKRAALRNLLEQHGIQLRPLGEAAASLADGSVSTFRQSGILFQATGWEQVEACLFR